MDDLLREVRGCTICAPHLDHGVRPVLQAHPDARVLIAGQAPGRRVHESGIPFRDPSGDRLRAWLGVTEQEFYDPRKIAILPMGFCYPGSATSGDLPPRPECAPAWRERLLAELAEVRLTVVLGTYAQRWHLGKRSSVTEAVRGWRDHWPERLPLPHPSPRNRGWRLVRGGGAPGTAGAGSRIAPVVTIRNPARATCAADRILADPPITTPPEARCPRRS